MTNLKPVNLKIIKHNLRYALKKSALDNDLPAVAKAAQAVFEAGYELEDMGYTEGFFTIICNQIVLSGWVPVLTDEMIANMEKRGKI